MPALCIRSEQYFLLEVVDRTGTVTLNMYISETHVHLAPAANFLAIKKGTCTIVMSQNTEFLMTQSNIEGRDTKETFPKISFPMICEYHHFCTFPLCSQQFCKVIDFEQGNHFLTHATPGDLLRMLSAFTPKFKQAANLAFIYSQLMQTC